MIFESSMAKLHDAIKIYDNFKGKTFLIAYRVNKDQPCNFIEFEFQEKHFWHLLGCKFDETKNLSSADKTNIYNDCLNGKDIREALNYTQTAADTNTKHLVFIQLFDFISHAKEIKITTTESSPEASMFRIGAGSVKGTIGYMLDGDKYFPKTTQDKSIFKINPVANDKIVFIMSKESNTEKYSNVEFEIKKGIISDLLDDIPSEIRQKISI